MSIDEKTKRAYTQIIRTAPAGGTSCMVSPAGDVIVVARAALLKDTKTISAAFAHADEQHDTASCLYGWYEDHSL